MLCCWGKPVAYLALYKTENMHRDIGYLLTLPHNTFVYASVWSTLGKKKKMSGQVRKKFLHFRKHSALWSKEEEPGETKDG